MEPHLIGWLSIGALILLLAMRVPVAFALATLGFLSYYALTGKGPAYFIAGTVPYGRTAIYTFTVIPLFIIMGHFAFHAGFVKDIFNTALKWVGNWPGGLVQATVIGSAAFGAACGSGIATCATVGRVTVPEMLRCGVQRGLAFGAVAAAGTIASMIPPSIVMVIYGILTEQSIGKLLIAGIIPGIVAALVYMAQIFIRVKLKPDLAPLTKGTTTWKDRFIALKNTWGILLLVLVIMGGIYSGVFTPTEAGAVGAFTTFVLALVLGRLKISELREALFETVKSTSMIFLILVGAAMFGYMLAITGIPTQISNFIIGAQVNRYFVLIGILILYLILGTIMDSVSSFTLTLPIIFPAITALGFDTIWFGVLLVHMSEVALVTPPFALNIFVLNSVIPDSTVEEIIRGVAPYLLADLTTLVIYIVFPQLSLWLPGMMT